MTNGTNPPSTSIKWSVAAFTSALVTLGALFTSFLPAEYSSLHLDYAFLYNILRFAGAQFVSTLLVLKGISVATK